MGRIGRLVVILILTGCAPALSERTVVTGTGDEPFLNLRAGPSLNFRVVLGLPEGTALYRRGCVTELGQRWCEVALADAPGLTGYVSADYLSSPPAP